MLVKNTYINIVSNVTGAAIGFLVSIMVVRVYGVTVIGKIAYMTGLVGLMTFVVDLGIDQTALKYISEKRKGFEQEFSAYVVIKMLLLFVFLIVASIFLLYIFRPKDQFLYLLVMGNIFFMTVADIFKTAMTARRNFFQLALQTNISRVIMFGFAIVFCTVVKNWYYIACLPSIEFFSLILISAPYFIFKMKIGRLEIHGNILRKFAVYAYPLSLTTGLSMAVAHLDKVFVGHLLSHAHVGYLAVAEKVFAIFDLIVKSLTKQLLPEIAYRLAHLKEKVFHDQMEKIVSMTNLLATFMALFVLLYADLLVEMMYGPDLEASAFILRLFTLMILVKLFLRPYISLIFATEKHQLFLWFTIPTSLIKIAVTYLLIPLNLHGVLIGGGAKPLGQAASWMLPRGLYILYVIRKTFGTAFMTGIKTLYPVFVVVGMTAVYFLRFLEGRVGVILGGGFVIALYIALLWVFGIIRKGLVQELIAPFRPLLKRLGDSSTH